MFVSTVVEDDLSNAVLRKMLNVTRPDIIVHSERVCGGFGDIKKGLHAFNCASALRPWIVLTDLDAATCPPSLIADWCGGICLNPNLVFRVAVRSIESWLLADRNAIASFLMIAVNRIPAYPEQVGDAKLELIQLAKSARKKGVRQALVPVPGAVQGPDYNDCLSTFVDQHWDLSIARTNSQSLDRALMKVMAL